MKSALIVYHKNADKIYPKNWLDKFCDSILNQTCKDFDIYEINYSGEPKRLFESSIFYAKEMNNFVDAMNFLIEKCISSGYDYIFNSNVDDYYSNNRIEVQLNYLRLGFDIVSSNFALVENDKCVKLHEFDSLIIESEFKKGNNIIAHPSVAFNVKFFKNNYYNPSEIPVEDFNLWKRALANGNSFFITKENLLYHRLHTNSVCQSENR